jgi:hypothetical protein
MNCKSAGNEYTGERKMSVLLGKYPNIWKEELKD